jgi:hypothetical protein
VICRNFASSRNLWKTVLPPSHGGGQGFESPRVHSENLPFCSINLQRTEKSRSRSGASYCNRTATEDRVRTCAKQATTGHTPVCACSHLYPLPQHFVVASLSITLSSFVSGALEQILYSILHTNFGE